MQDLRLVAANERGTHLVLRSPEGEKYVVSIDERLRAAIRGDRALVGQLDSGDGQLRPAEIQARIRAGASAEQVARAAGVHIDRVRRFEGPVLAEREHVAAQAQRAAVRRPGQADPRPVPLSEVLPGRLAEIGLAIGDTDWDSWRRDDGRWVVQAGYDHDGDAQLAKFVFDPKARTVHADNDCARWLTGEVAEHPQRGPFVPRFAPVPDAAASGENDAEGDADDPPAVPTPASIKRPDPMLNRRPPDVVARPAPSAPAAPAPPRPATVVTPPAPAPTLLPPVPAAVPAAAPAARLDAPAAAVAPPAPAPPARRRPVVEAPTLPMETEAEAVPEQAARTGTNDGRGEGLVRPEPPARKSRRASVPSWDDILIGTRRPD